MPLKSDLLKILDKRFEVSAMVERRYKGLDIAFKTNESGDPILLFIGRKDAHGKINGQRYVRTLLFDNAGRKIKDHWELKGKAT